LQLELEWKPFVIAHLLAGPTVMITFSNSPVNVKGGSYWWLTGGFFGTLGLLFQFGILACCGLVFVLDVEDLSMHHSRNHGTSNWGDPE
jgi:hypothetical protein